MIRSVLIGMIRIYQLMISPYFPTSCRYTPTCSQYAVEALRKHGVLKGAGLAAWRLLRCHPWSRGGDDPVPENTKTSFDESEARNNIHSALAGRSDSMMQQTPH